MARIGIRLPKPSETDQQTTLALAELADKKGLSTAWVGESWDRNGAVLMTQVLERTETIDVCSGVFNVYSRTPALIAMTAAGLADVSGDRIRIGLGTSGPDVIERFHGVSYAEPLRREREYIEIISQLLAGEPAEYDGAIFTVEGFRLNPPQEYSIPLYIAAMGDSNLQLTGEFADGWIPMLVPHFGLPSALETVKEAAKRTDRSPDDIDVAPWIPTCISATEPEAARAHVREMLAFYVGAMGDYYQRSIAEYGFSAITDRIDSAWESGETDEAATAVTDEMLDAFTASGRPREAASTFEAFREAGADMPVAYPPAAWAPAARLRETVEHLPVGVE
ncbi:LLM class flavin-dependent oxidoreductase [Halobacteriales archaeon Cl-PHB]